METWVPPPKGPQQATAASLRTPYGIGDLPAEVLLNIFQFFNVNELDYTISPVCRLWRELSRRPCLRLELALEGNGPDAAVAIEMLLSCPNLKDLSIFDRDDADHLICHVTLYNQELRRLAVNSCDDGSDCSGVYTWKISKITDDGVSHLSRLQNLESLDLTGLQMVSSFGWERMFFESHWRQMKNLSLAGCDDVDDDTLQQVASACPNLVTLNLTWCDDFTDVGLTSVLQTCKDLEELRIWTTQKYVFRSFSYIPSHTRKLKRLVYDQLGIEEENSVFMHLKETVPELQIHGW